jgi:hypothetical protein
MFTSFLQKPTDQILLIFHHLFQIQAVQVDYGSCERVYRAFSLLYLDELVQGECPAESAWEYDQAGNHGA